MERDGPSIRIDYVDRLRGLAVLGMFAVHSPHPWISAELNRGAFARVISQISGSIAPVFVFLAGVSVAIVAHRAGAEGSGRARARIAIRGFEVLAAAYGLQLLFWALGDFEAHWTRVLRVDILNCIGAMLLLAATLMWPSSRFNWRALFGFVLLFLGAQVTWRMNLHLVLPSGLAGYLAYAPKTAPFPLLPYGAWLPLGLLFGQAFARAVAEPKRERRFWIGVAAIGLGAVLAGWLLRMIPGIAPWEAFGLDPAPIRATVHHLVHKGGQTLLLFVAARLTTVVFDRARLSVLVLWGRTSLFAYCLHLVLVHYAIGGLWKRSMAIWQWAVGVVALAVVMYFACLVWRRWRPPSLAGLVSSRDRG